MKMTAKLNGLEKYPKIIQFVIDYKLDIKNNSYLSTAINRNYPRLESIEYFLGHSKDLENGNNLRNKLRCVVGKRTGPQDYLGLESFLAELEAFYLLQNKFGLNISKYEPPMDKQNKKRPEFEVQFNSVPVYFEVKSRCSDAVQRIHEETHELLDRIEQEYKNKYVISIMKVENSKNKNKRPNCLELFSKYLLESDILKLIENEIKERLNLLECTNILAQQNRNSSVVPVKNIKVGKEEVDIHFLIDVRKNDHKRPRFLFNHDSIEDIQKWLFEEKPELKKTPQIKQAETKGSDYLICKIEARKSEDETFHDYIKPLFSNINLIDDHYAESNDPKLGTKLSGLILFFSGVSLFDDYIVVNNRNVNPKIKNWDVKGKT